MSSEYKVDLPKILDQKEDSDHSVASVSIHNNAVLIKLSYEAMLALGADLIRWAHQSKKPPGTDIREIEPIEHGMALTELGISLHPQSAKLVFVNEVFPTAQELAETTKTK